MPSDVVLSKSDRKSATFPDAVGDLCLVRREVARHEAQPAAADGRGDADAALVAQPRLARAEARRRGRLCRGKPVGRAGFRSDFSRFCPKPHQESAFLDDLISQKAL